MGIIFSIFRLVQFKLRNILEISKALQLMFSYNMYNLLEMNHWKQNSMYHQKSKKVVAILQLWKIIKQFELEFFFFFLTAWF